MTYINLFVFSTDAAAAARLVAAGATGVVIDWERRGKRRRQAGADTQVNADTPRDLARVRAATGGRLLCRINGWGRSGYSEIETAVRLGADEVLLPMVRRPEQVDLALAAAAGRCGLGILVETQQAVQGIDELLRRPLSRVYVGLNDLMIDRGAASLFAPLVDGTVDRLRCSAAAAGVPFGVAGLTLPGAGWPVPCRLLVAALARLDAGFTFLRRSFHADVARRDVSVEVPAILEAVANARQRHPRQVAVDHRELRAFVERVSDPALVVGRAS